MAVLDEADCTTHLDCNKNRHLSSRRAGWEEGIEEREREEDGAGELHFHGFPRLEMQTENFLDYFPTCRSMEKTRKWLTLHKQITDPSVYEDARYNYRPLHIALCLMEDNIL